MRFVDPMQRMGGMTILPGTGRGTIRRRANGGGGSSLRKPAVYGARKLRRGMTLPEAMLWQRLRGRRISVKVRRQHPIGPYVVVAQMGYRILRIPAVDVLKDIDTVIEGIAVQVTSPLHHPSDGPPPHAGED